MSHSAKRPRRLPADVHRVVVFHDFVTGKTEVGGVEIKGTKMPRTTTPPWNDVVQCFVRALYVDHDAHAGSLFMGANSCTDMSGCIALFQRIHPGIRRIDTWQSDGKRHRRDTAYKLQTDGRWIAVWAE